MTSDDEHGPFSKRLLDGTAASPGEQRVAARMPALGAAGTSTSALSGSLVDGTHRLPVRVYYEDTDFSGVVYHASYLRFLERGRTELLRATGVDQSMLHAGEQSLIFAVRKMTIDYLRPARMDDVLQIETCTSEIRGASLFVTQRILRETETIVTADVQVAAIAGGRPVRIPEPLRSVLGGQHRR
jgi:acyl-CoA thioester hydrolase